MHAPLTRPVEFRRDTRNSTRVESQSTCAETAFARCCGFTAISYLPQVRRWLAWLPDANESWKQTLTLAGGGNSSIISDSGNSFDVFLGCYVGARADCQLSEHWGIAAGVQFQDLATYDHNFSGRNVVVDLSSSWFVTLGLSYTF